MEENYFDVEAALKDHSPEKVAEHLAKLHGVDRDAYLKDGMTDAQFLSEFKVKPLPKQEEEEVAASSSLQQPSNMTNVIGGAVAVGAPAVATYGVHKAGDIARKALGINPNTPTPTAAPPIDVQKQFVSPEAVEQRIISSSKAARPEGPTDVVNWSMGKDPGTGQYRRGYLGGGSQEEEALLHKQANALEAANPGQKIMPGTHNLLIPEEEHNRIISEKAAEEVRRQAEASANAKEAAELRKNRLAQVEPSTAAKVGKGAINIAKAPIPNRFAAGYNAMDALQAQNPFEAGVSVTGIAAPHVMPQIAKMLPKKYRGAAEAIGNILPYAAPAINAAERKIIEPEHKANGGLAIQNFAGGKLATAAKMAAKMSPAIEGSLGKILPSAAFKAAPEQTVTNPLRNAFPGIYKRPDVIAQEAAARVAPESDALKRLFGVTRDDLYEMGKGRVGNISGVLPGAAANPKGSKAAVGVMNPSNEQRLLDVLSESEKYPALVKGMDPWYIMDPAYKRLEELVGPEEAIKKYKQLNTLTGMASPGSDVLTEMNRGTAANYLATQGRFNDFVDYAGKPIGARGADFPEDIRSVLGHPYHKTAQATPMQQYLDSGQVQMSSPKVPMYIDASGVPQTGFQTDMPVGDAHWSRAVGLADTRGTATRKGKEVVPGASVSNPEMSQLGPWWRDKIASQAGLESVPAQARAWGAFSPQTGVESPIGAPKLELLATKIMEAANRYGVSPEQARDMILKGEGYAGKKKGGKVKKGKKK